MLLFNYTSLQYTILLTNTIVSRAQNRRKKRLASLQVLYFPEQTMFIQYINRIKNNRQHRGGIECPPTPCACCLLPVLAAKSSVMQKSWWLEPFQNMKLKTHWRTTGIKPLLMRVSTILWYTCKWKKTTAINSESCHLRYVIMFYHLETKASEY